MGREPAWELARGDPRECRCRVGEATRPPAYAPNDRLTAIHLLFKLPVVLLLNPEKVYAVISRLLFEVTDQAVLDTSEGSSQDEYEEDEFFKMGKELESCSEKQRKDLLEQTMFPSLSHAAWLDVFVKYNTAIPSSAAVERLFSQGSDIMKAERAGLTSYNFDRLVFMKGNMDLLNME
ncbi:hypothetical protein GWK47_033730 [Chionoecetes opilio]|uniref:HAT C-terminal dimerisation domain-containing protein n=1 Tax=Chionoecetes opilio TaxID=41210 RepID=A0A8J4YGQ2_CHIOP|nr:hypothetical protein GWK47_033730 [Chionoecetes opilio]